MTLQEFLLKSQGVDLTVSTDSTVSHIRQHVQNIDVLASETVNEMYYEDIRDIFVAIILDRPSMYAVYHNDAWAVFEKEALRLNFTQSEIDAIHKKNKPVI